MIDYECTTCGEPLSSPDSLLGHFEKCPVCHHRVKIPDLKARELRAQETLVTLQRLRERGLSLSGDSEPATERQINYARTLGIEFEEGMTKIEMSLLLTRYERAKHYLYGLWLYMTGKSATERDDSSDFIKRAAVAMLNQDPKTAEKVSDLVSGNGFGVRHGG